MVEMGINPHNKKNSQAPPLNYPEPIINEGTTAKYFNY